MSPGILPHDAATASERRNIEARLQLCRPPGFNLPTLRKCALLAALCATAAWSRSGDVVAGAAQQLLVTAPPPSTGNEMLASSSSLRDPTTPRWSALSEAPTFAEAAPRTTRTTVATAGRDSGAIAGPSSGGQRETPPAVPTRPHRNRQAEAAANLVPAREKPDSETTRRLIDQMGRLIDKQYKWDDYVPWFAAYKQLFSPGFTYFFSFPGTNALQRIPKDPRWAAALPDPYVGTFDKQEPPDYGEYPSLLDWFWGEHVPWNVAFRPVKFFPAVGFASAVNQEQLTLLAYAEGVFVGDFKGLPHLPTEEYASWLSREGAKWPAHERIAAFERALYGGGLPSTRRGPPAAPRDVDLLYGQKLLPLKILTTDLDFYTVGVDKKYSNNGLGILYNSCMVDVYGMMVQTGRRLLHVALPVSEDKPFVNRLNEHHGRFAGGGAPTPWPVAAHPGETEATSKVFPNLMHRLLLAPSSENPCPPSSERDSSKRTSCGSSGSVFRDIFHIDGVLHMNPFGLGAAESADDVDALLDAVFGAAFTSKRVQLVGNKQERLNSGFCEGRVCAAHGFLQTQWVGPWLGMAPGQGGEVRLRFAMHLNLQPEDVGTSASDAGERSERGAPGYTYRIKDAYINVDLPSAALQMGRDLVLEAQRMQ